MHRTFQLKRRRALNSNNASKHSAQLLQAYGVLVCLYEVLLHADGEDAVVYAEAAHVAANLINNAAEQLDSAHIGRLIVA